MFPSIDFNVIFKQQVTTIGLQHNNNVAYIVHSELQSHQHQCNECILYYDVYSLTLIRVILLVRYL